MSLSDYYSPSCQFRRALNRDWRLLSIDLLCGILYPVVGFYVFRRVGESQVYSVVWPFVLAAGFMLYLTRRLCLPEAKRDSAAYFFNLPQDRLVALDSHIVFLGVTTLWFNAWVLAGSLLKLGGAGLTACYRLHPECFVLPFLVLALTLRHIYLKHTRMFCVGSVVWYLLLTGWFVWKGYRILDLSLRADHPYWPDRPMSLRTEWAVATLMAAVAVWLIYHIRNQWRQRQIGEIR